jgi:enhancing lycopene biosynthesis protein 2
MCTHRQILAFLYIKNDGADLVCYGPGKPKNNVLKIIIQESPLLGPQSVDRKTLD